MIAFDHNVRNAARAAARRGRHPRPGRRAPITTSPTARAASARRRELAARGLDPALLAGRFAIVNLWRPIGRPVEKSPLALCDARIVARRRPDRLRPRLSRPCRRDLCARTSIRRQRWYHFPRLAPDEAILIKGYDSADDVARFTAHSAFEDPASPPDAPERESIEVRGLVIY